MADDAPAATAAAGRIGTAGRRGRLAVTVVGSLALLVGTFWGSDDHFPFGPFKMYANASRNDGLVRSARVEAVNAEGDRFKLTDASTGLRRAEIEGQMPLFREDPDRLHLVAEAYHDRHPGSPELVLVEILQRRYQLVDGQPSGEVTEHQIAAWTAPGHEWLAGENADPLEEDREEAHAADDGPDTVDDRDRAGDEETASVPDDSREGGEATTGSEDGAEGGSGARDRAGAGAGEVRP